MLILQQTSIYQDCMNIVSNILNTFGKDKNSLLTSALSKEALRASVNLAKALENIDNEETYELHSKNTAENIVAVMTLLGLAIKKGEIHEQQGANTLSDLEKLYKKILNFPLRRKKILILSSSMGQGHMSASKAVKQGIEQTYGLDYQVEIVDFWEEMNAFFNKATKKAYESSTKFAPKLYKFIFAGTDTKWQMKLINQLNYPFVLTKVKKLFEEKNPDLVISTYPIWDYITAEIWKKCKPYAKFLSIVTDSISIHNAWAIADTDFHIVANDDTALSLRKLGVKPEKIKVLGFPVRLEFLKTVERAEFLKGMNLDPKKFTILFLPTAQKAKLNLQIMEELQKNNNDCNIIVITGRDEKLKPKLEKIIGGKNSASIKIIGWTEEMANFIKCSDILITKAGGATVMECIAMAKPMIITSIIPGQEEGNGELIKRYQLGIIPAETNMDINESIHYLRRNYKQFQQNISKMSNPQAALKIAGFINSIL